MHRRRFLRSATLAGAAIGALPACGDIRDRWETTTVRAYRIGWLSETTVTPANSVELEAFHQRFAALGHKQGKTYNVEHRFSGTVTSQLPTLAGQFVRDSVDVIVAINLRSAEAAKAATHTIPVVFHSKEDPVAAGLVESYARPGGNLTGIGENRGAAAGKRFAILLDAFPWIRHIVVLFNPAASHEVVWQGYEIAARALPATVQRIDMPWTRDVLPYLEKARQAGADAIIASFGAASLGIALFTEAAITHHIPVMFDGRGPVKNFGGLMSYGSDPVAAHRRMAEMVDSIVRGRRPADIPVEQPATFEFVINAKVAKQAGLAIPPFVLAQASEVIQ